jgi:hypothetical protein
VRVRSLGCVPPACVLFWIAFVLAALVSIERYFSIFLIRVVGDLLFAKLGALIREAGC